MTPRHSPARAGGRRDAAKVPSQPRVTDGYGAIGRLTIDPKAKRWGRTEHVMEPARARRHARRAEQSGFRPHYSVFVRRLGLVGSVRCGQVVLLV